MKSMLVGLAAFAAGALVGFFGSNILLKKKYNEELEEAREQLRASVSRLQSRLEHEERKNQRKNEEKEKEQVSTIASSYVSYSGDISKPAVDETIDPKNPKGVQSVLTAAVSKMGDPDPLDEFKVPDQLRQPRSDKEAYEMFSGSELWGWDIYPITEDAFFNNDYGWETETFIYSIEQGTLMYNGGLEEVESPEDLLGQNWLNYMVMEGPERFGYFANANLKMLYEVLVNDE